MGKCAFQITDQEQCGMPAVGSTCALHEWERIQITDAQRDDLAHYIKESPHLHDGVLHLAGLKFRDVNWHDFLKDFCGEIDFSGVEFDRCKFHDMIFGAPAHFNGAEFKLTPFEVVSFQSGADFSETRFYDGTVPFTHCTFRTDTFGDNDEPIDIQFQLSVFMDSAMPFPACSMSGGLVTFRDASIAGDTLRLRICSPGVDEHKEQYLSMSCDEIDFSNLRFNGNFDFVQDFESFGFSSLLSFKRVRFTAMQSATFIDVNLERARFRHSTLETVGFIGCRWPRRLDRAKGDSSGRKGRKILYEDILSRSCKDEEQDQLLGEIVRLYIQLKRNWENRLNHVGAGDWFYREMECRRRTATGCVKWGRMNSWAYRTPSRAYYVLSRYGESYMLPLLWLLAAYVSFSLLYLMLGIPVDAGGRELNYDLGTGRVFLWKDIFRALAFGFQAMTLRLPSYVDFGKWAGWPLYVLQFLSTATLVPLFLLALRRKFRR